MRRVAPRGSLGDRHLLAPGRQVGVRIDARHLRPVVVPRSQAQSAETVEGADPEISAIAVVAQPLHLVADEAAVARGEVEVDLALCIDARQTGGRADPHIAVVVLLEGADIGRGKAVRGAVDLPGSHIQGSGGTVVIGRQDVHPVLGGHPDAAVPAGENGEEAIARESALPGLREVDHAIVAAFEGGAAVVEQNEARPAADHPLEAGRSDVHAVEIEGGEQPQLLLVEEVLPPRRIAVEDGDSHQGVEQPHVSRGVSVDVADDDEVEVVGGAGSQDGAVGGDLGPAGLFADEGACPPAAGPETSLGVGLEGDDGAAVVDRPTSLRQVVDAGLFLRTKVVGYAGRPHLFFPGDGDLVEPARPRLAGGRGGLVADGVETGAGAQPDYFLIRGADGLDLPHPGGGRDALPPALPGARQQSAFRGGGHDPPPAGPETHDRFLVIPSEAPLLGIVDQDAPNGAREENPAHLEEGTHRSDVVEGTPALGILQVRVVDPGPGDAHRGAHEERVVEEGHGPDRRIFREVAEETIGLLDLLAVGQEEADADTRADEEPRARGQE